MSHFSNHLYKQNLTHLQSTSGKQTKNQFFYFNVSGYYLHSLFPYLDNKTPSLYHGRYTGNTPDQVKIFLLFGLTLEQFSFQLVLWIWNVTM